MILFLLTFAITFGIVATIGIGIWLIIYLAERDHSFLATLVAVTLISMIIAGMVAFIPDSTKPKTQVLEEVK